MNDLISRKALIAEYDRVHVGPPGGARKLMEDAPAVDAVPVVRCKDCIYQNKLKVTGGVLCDHKKGLMSTKLKDDDFCSYGKRRATNEAD